MPPILDQKEELGGAELQLVSPRKQRRQMLIAMVLLLAAVVLLLLKDWRVWFPAPPAASVAPSLEKSAEPPAPPAEVKTPAPHPAQTLSAKGPAPTATTAPPAAPSVVTDRAVLPPLQVEVVAGTHRRSVPAATNSVSVDLQSDAEPQPAAAAPAPTDGTVVNAAETMRISAHAAQVVSRPVEPSYPVLAKQMKVQGSVILQALIDRTGNIQDLHVLSGPAILSSAAMQAVKQWRFRPYYLAGEAVETQARITVNFTISAN
jgi:protein TonB